MSENRVIGKQNIGNAGEYYLAARLSALDFTVTITLGRAEKYDLLVISPTGRLSKISVKTRQSDKENRFPLSKNDERGDAQDFYYALIRISTFEKEPDIWIIPSVVVCPIIRDAHEKWLNILGKNDRPHQDTRIRNLWITANGKEKVLYPNNWNLEVEHYYRNFKQLL